jgi:hypothetical protein
MDLFGLIMINDLKKYKESIVVIDHLNVILKIINLSIKGLQMFSMYTPVARILYTLENERAILECHYYKYNRIKESKGKIE